MTVKAYAREQTIHDGPVYAIHRGRRLRDGTAVLIKTACSGSANAASIADRLHWEFEITRSVNVDGVLPVLDLVDSSPRVALILEDHGYELLSDVLASAPLDRIVGLRLALRLATIVGSVHQNGIVHKAIHPNHILYRRETGQVMLTGFEAASRLPEVRPEQREPGLRLEMLTYLAPEQTGRMNRRVSFQTDFYSFGVLLYKLFTGRVPFDIADPLELVHAHIAREPVPPIAVNHEIPRALSAIVMKLLAKAAEDRYQGIQGLRADLKDCIDGRDKPDFVPGRRDISDKIRIPEKLYGRSAEIDVLLDAFDRVSNGSAEMLLVSGYSGIGKSALVNEVQKPIVRRHGYFISGKFDQFKRNIPYSAFISAFRQLTRALLAEDKAHLDAWRTRLRDALGENGQVITSVIPEIELIIGPQSPVPDLPPAESQNRFNLVFERFLKVFAHRDHPLVVFLDDLQWADAATLGLLLRLAGDATLQNLLIIGAYRDNEVDAGHPLVHTLAEIEAAGTAMTRIVLGPLAFEDLHQLVSDTLRCVEATATPLTRLIHNKTAGNPFFVIQLIKLMVGEGLLSFDYKMACWTFELAGISQVDITDNVVDLMIRKIAQLPEPTQSAVKLAACIGNTFDLQMLAIVSQSTTVQTAVDLRDAIHMGLVIPTSESSHRLAEFSAPVRIAAPAEATYRFLHDRVQQAAYLLIPESEKTPVHLRVGRLMWQHCDGDTLEENLFEIVGHLNIGAAMIEDRAERIRLIELNLKAGYKAKNSTAYEPALNYFADGVSQLPDDAWTAHYELAFALHLQRAECCYLCGRFDRAERQLEALLKVARSPLEKGEIYRIRIVEYENTSRFEEARDWGKTGLALFDIRFPDSSDECTEMLDEEVAAIRNLLGSRDIEELVELPVMTDDAKRISMRLLMTMWAPAYISGDMMLTCLVAAKMVHLSLAYGNVEESAYGYVTYAATIGLGAADYASSYQFGRLALKVNERFDDLTARAKVNHMFSCYIGFWRKPMAECLPYSREAFKAGLSSGDFIYAAYGVYHETWHALFSGRQLGEFNSYYAPYLAFMSKSKNQTFFDALQIMLHSGLVLQGRTEDHCSLTSKDFDEAEYVNTYGSLDFFMSFYYVIKLRLYYLFGRYDEAAAMARLAERAAANSAGMIWDVWRCFYQALTLTARYPSLDAGDRSAADTVLDGYCARLQTWADNCSENFSCRHALVVAEIAALRNDIAGAICAYEQAIAAAHAQGFVQIEALASECYARFWQQRNNETIAGLYLGSAERCYLRWGATAKVDDLQRRNRRQSALPAYAAPLARLDFLDTATALRAAQVISAEIDQGRLIGKLLRIVLENAGAERGLLLLTRQGRLVIEASGSLGENGAIEFPATSAASSPDLATSIVHYVANSSEAVVLSDASHDNRFSSDQYIEQNEPLSVLCMPILHQGRPIGMIYLENNLVRDAFTPERIEVVGLLASQAAISLENARLYGEMRQEVVERKSAEAALQQAHDELEARVADRTEALSEANLRLRKEVVERRQTEFELHKAKETAETAAAAKGEFLASMSHELRTPLNAILGYAQILQRGGQLTESQLNGVVTIERSGEHLLTLINDILSLSKAEAGKLEVSLSDFRLRDFLDDICDIARVRAEQKRLAFHYELRSRLPKAISGDERWLRQVLLNLLSNATKFTECGGVTLRVTYDDAERTKPRLLFEVADTGIGIAPEKLEKIFEPFQQLHRANRHEEGTGLGLTISRKLVELMGGSMEVHSTPGKGSIFIVAFALPEQAFVELSPKDKRITGFEGPAKKILVVDDKAENRTVLTGLLEPLGFALAEAQDGRAALEKAATWRPDAILLDLVMPVMDGFEAARRISRSPELSGIVILALSASVFEHHKTQSIAAGCREFFPKPVQFDLMLDKLKEHLQLTWLYAGTGSGTRISPPGAGRPVVATEAIARPPRTVLRTLHHFAVTGDIQAIRNQLEILERENHRMKPFVSELRYLASRYDLQQIAEFVEPSTDASGEHHAG